MSASDLHSLLPTHVGPLPERLLSLAAALLQQSRSRISALKPTEEIARSYVCAHLACERLKNALDLPAVTSPRPPLPGRQYAALLAHFRGQLSGVAEPVSPRKQRALSPVKQPTLTSRDGSKQTLETVIRDFCARLSVPGAAPYVLRGVRASRREGDDVRTVMSAVALMVIERMCPVKGRRVGGVHWKRGEAYVKKRITVTQAAGRDVVGMEVDRVVKRVSEEGDPWLEAVPDRGRRKMGRGRMLRPGMEDGWVAWSQRVMRKVGMIESEAAGQAAAR